MAIIKQKNKRTGLTYVYESISWRDKEKNQSRCKRRLIGRWDEKTGTVVPTDGRCRKDRPPKAPAPPKEKKVCPITEDEYELLYKKAAKEIKRLKDLLTQKQNKIAELEAAVKSLQ